MGRIKVYRAVIFATHVLRWLEWASAAVFAGLVFFDLQAQAQTTGVGVGVSGFMTAQLVAVFIAAFAFDRVMYLIDDDLTRRLPSKGEASP